MRRLLALMLMLALAATPAVAADPERGEVSKASPKVSWEGAVTSFQSWQTYNAGQGHCIPPSCDTFTLEVKDAAPLLNVTVESGDSTMFVEVVKPDGSSELFSGETKAVGKLKNPAAGTYTINVAQNEQTQAVHKGTAELVFPAAPAPAPAPAGPAAPAAPAASNAPAPTVSLKAGRVKGRSLSVTIKTSAPITNVSATLLRGKKTVGKGSLAKVNGSAVLKLKLRGKPKRGRYTLKLSAIDEQGRPVAKSGSARI